MATIDLTLEQILEAVEQLSPTERRRLQRRIAKLETSARPTPSLMRMGRRERRRMSELLLKANSGPLTASEDAELNSLVDEFESQALANAEALTQRKDTDGSGRRSSQR